MGLDPFMVYWHGRPYVCSSSGPRKSFQYWSPTHEKKLPFYPMQFQTHSCDWLSCLFNYFERWFKTSHSHLSDDQRPCRTSGGEPVRKALQLLALHATQPRGHTLMVWLVLWAWLRFLYPSCLDLAKTSTRKDH